MNALIDVVLGAITVYLTYTRYARRIDRDVIQSDPKRATPATLYMDGVDFMPTNRNILFGYHFKSIAAAGPIVGAIVAATLWGWLPAMIWLIVGVAFMGWVSDYSAIVLSVRNEGHSLSAVAHRLISPRTRTILFLFIFFYLLLVAGAFVGIMATVMETQPRTYMGMILLVIMGLLLGQMLYRWRVGLVPATMITVGITLVAIMTGHASEPAFKGWNPQMGPAGVMPLWPMLFVTIACGAISGWHALFGSVGTARQIENEADMLPVGAGSMLAEFLLGMLALLAISIGAKGNPVAAFASGLGGFISVWGFPPDYAVSLAFAAFIVIVLVVTQLLFRVMRVTLTEWLGEIIPPLRNQHVASLVSIGMAILLVMTGTWIYLWQLFGAANQLMAALSLLLVTVWLVSVGEHWLFAGIPMLFMSLTTLASVLVTSYNLYFNVYLPNLDAGRLLPTIGSGLMVLVAVLLVFASVFIGIDGFRAFFKYLVKAAPSV